MAGRIRIELQQRRLLRIAMAAVSGVALALAFPNTGWGWLAFVALTPLIAAAVTARGKLEALLLGWLTITLTWLINIPWVIIVMSRYGGLPQPLGIAIFVTMCLVLGGYGGLFALLVHLLRLGSALGPWLAVPAIWAVIEYARTFWFSGFPWHLIATALIDLSPLAQPARWLGPYGLGMLVTGVSTALAWLTIAEVTRRRRNIVAMLLIGFVALWMIAGLGMLSRQERQMAAESKYLAAMIQPNISQQMRWDDQNMAIIFDRMARLTEQSLRKGAEVVVWPESTIPLRFFDAYLYRSFVEATARQFDADIILGSVAQDAEDPTKVWNAAYLVSRGAVSGRYDKLRLVPFGEYVPLRRLFFFAGNLVREVGAFQFGTNEFPLVGKFKYGPAICYEVVYPRIPATQVDHGAEVLVTITNDAWFDRSSAPRQHLNHVRMRAIETDRYFLRAATTGISALIDPTGRIVHSLDLDQEGVLLGEFAPRHSETAYVRFGDWPAWLAILFVVYRLSILGYRARKDRATAQNREPITEDRQPKP
jgi:apolipoprotein N-acyltransferase